MKRNGKWFWQVLLIVGLLTACASTAVAQEPAFGSDRDEPGVSVEGDVSVQDQVISDDLILQASLCVGFDCVNGENFSYDTIILKENNLQIYFNDTSSASFPNNDWRLVANSHAMGGESYFALEDATAGVFSVKVMAGAPLNSLFVDASGNVGLGTDSPEGVFHVKGDGSPDALVLQSNGNLVIGGALTEMSDANRKENFAPVDGGEVLARLAEVPVQSWNFKGDGAVRHIGPTAQDFRAAFGLGLDERHISPLDTNGVALAAIQELYRQVKAHNGRISEQAVQIELLQEQNALLRAELAALK